MTAAAANNFAATTARAAGGNAAAACTILSTIRPTLSLQRFTQPHMRNVQVKTPKPANRFKM